MVNYPSSLDNSASLPLAVDNSTPVSADVFNRLRNAIIAVENELGTNPKGIYGTVKNRLDTLEGLILSSGTFAAGGDLSGTGISQTVIGIQGNKVKAEIEGSSHDGYVLTWVNANNQWEAKLGSSTKVQNGSNYGGYLITPTFQPFSTASGTFINAACFEFDPTLLTAANGTRTITLHVIVETTTPQITVQLYNATTHSVVTGSTLTSTSATAVTLTTGDLTANLTNGLATYFVQIEMNAGTVSDRATLDYAALKVVWS
jgi:hypothetical protein